LAGATAALVLNGNKAAQNFEAAAELDMGAI
jgi:hypothetical protein